MIRMLVVDDHLVVREGVKRIVAETPDMCVVGEASDVPEALACLATGEVDVVLLDLALPERKGLEVLQCLKHTHPKVPVLVFSAYAEEQYAVRTLKAGAAGYLTKACLPGELVHAVRKVVQGGRYASASLAEYLVLALTEETEQPLHACLSDREYQVFCLLATGKTVTAIAAELALSAKTISTYRARILDKMHLHTTGELIHYSIRHGHMHAL
jgi:two-component system, NarL family, invasion response regulator UvrY